MATLSTGALRQAVGSDPRFPPAVVLEYGALLTVVLLLAYVPASLSVRALGRDLMGRLPKMPPLDSDEWVDWDQTRKAVRSFLQLDRGIFDQLQASIFVLAPLLSAALSFVIPTRAS